MLKNILVTIMLLTMIVFVEPATALDLRIQPRFKVGVQYYEFSQGVINAPIRDPRGQFNSFLNKAKFSDWMPVVSGGSTLFIDRFFVDFNARYSFDGSSESGFSGQNYVIGGGEGGLPVDAIFRNTGKVDADFERFELTVSAGFEVLDNLLLFGGYQYAETKFTSDITGKLNTLLAGDLSPILPLTGDLTGGADINFNFKGPFVGANYTWPIQLGFMNGGLSFNFAAAFLKNETMLDLSRLGVKSAIGTVQSLNIKDGEGRSFFALEGKTTGYSFGIGWQGLTPVDGLIYSMGATGYIYQFEESNTDETRVRLDFGLSYAFDFFD